MRQKLTPWIDGSIKPERVVVYQRYFNGNGKDIPSKIWWARWDGEQWCAGSPDMREASLEELSTVYEHLPWRGLASDPRKRK